VAYTKTSWVDGTTGITAAQLNRIETGVDQAYGEEGSWTPAFNDGTFTYTSQTGRYVRHGDLVTVRFRIAWSAYTAGSGGGLEVQGLPYAVDSNWVATLGILVPFGGIDVPASSPPNIYGFHLSATSTGLDLVYATDVGSVAIVSSKIVSVVHLPDSGDVRGSITYRTSEAFA